MRYIVTGAAGFIGSNLVEALNQRGVTDIIVVDELIPAMKYRNLADLDIADYVDKSEFLDSLEAGRFGKIDWVLHQGACSDTMESNGKMMMENNFRYTLRLLDLCQSQKIPLLYASSAATYGGSGSFIEARQFEKPLNVYGYSKFLFDQVLRRRLLEKSLSSQVVGFRYFNVYGPRESHKGRMASVAFHHFHEYTKNGVVKLFGSHDGYEAGEQSRDFVSVSDVVKVNLFFLDHPEKSGIFNLGTGRAQPFNDIAKTVVNSLEKNKSGNDFSEQSLENLVKNKKIQYIDFPDDLKGKYQSFTEASLEHLRHAGYQQDFLSVEQGVGQYITWLSANADYLAAPL